MADVIKFLHASDLHLDRPITGLSEIPGHLKATLANAPYEAAQRFFDTAIAENVDFVLLSGDVACMDRGGPRTAAFLLNQFERLADKEIFVYWCAGEIDQPDRWPASIELPDNVITFSSSVVERVTHRRNGKEIATIFGIGYDGKKRVSGEFRAEESDPFPIALSFGELENSNLALHQIRYWALGGKHRRQVIDKATTVVVYPGTTQGRCLSESGSHSCTLGRVDKEGSLKIHEIDVDRVRWLPQTLAVAENIKLEDLQNVLADRALKVATEALEKLVLVNWHLKTAGDFNPRIRQEAWRTQVLKWLRNELGQDSEKGIWSVGLTVQPPKNLPASWYEEDTILGDYLRSVARYHADESMQLGLHEYIPAAIQDDSLATIGRVTKERRAEILREAAMVGVEYLSQHDFDSNDEQ